MFNFRTVAIIKRELKERIMSRTFIIMTLLLPVFMFGIMALQTFLFTYDTESNAKLIIVSESTGLTQTLESDFYQLTIVKQGQYKTSFLTLDKTKLQQLIDKNKQDLLNDKLNGIVYVPLSGI